MDEYKLHNMAPKVISLNNQKLIVPYEYAAEGDDWQIKRYFLSDYLDLQQIEAEKYRKNGEMPKTIRLGEVTYIVPFTSRNKNRKDTEVIDSILTRCQRKYNKAISLARKLSKIYPDNPPRVLVSKSHKDELQQQYNAYLKETCKSNIKYMAAKTAEFAAAGVKSVALLKDPQQLKLLAKKLAVGVSLVGVLSGLSYGETSSIPQIKSKKKIENVAKAPQKKQQPVEKSDTKTKAEPKTTKATEPKAQKAEKLDVQASAAKVIELDEDKFKRSAKEKDALFDKFVKEVFESEGGYADAKKIDQPTNMGIIQSTLKGFREAYPETARKGNFPTDVKYLKRNQAKLIYKKLYFEHYKIADYFNESIGVLIFDMYVNHTPATVEDFINQGLKEARKHGAEVSLAHNAKEQVESVNKLAKYPEAEKAFHNMLLKERKFHMYKKTTKRVKNGEIVKSRFADGLKRRAEKYDGTYVSSIEQLQKSTTWATLLKQKGNTRES